MASNKIGSVQFDLIENDPHLSAPREATQQRERVGIDYETIEGIGQRASEVTWGPCLSWETSKANADTFAASLAAIQGTIVTVYDASATAFEYVLVLDIGQGAPQKVYKDGNERWQISRMIRLRKLRPND